MEPIYNHVIRTEGLPNGVYTIGRSATCEFMIMGQFVSREHAQLVKQDDALFLVDHSTNGTTYDGHRLKKGMMARIKDGSIVYMANIPVKIGGKSKNV